MCKIQSRHCKYLNRLKSAAVKSCAMKATAPSFYDYNKRQFVQQREKEGDGNDKDE